MPLRPISRPKVPRVGRPTGKFTQHRRLDFLREKLEAHPAGLLLEDLATMLRVSTRSVRRYLRELSLVTEVESVEVRAGGVHIWRIKPSERGRTVALRRTQAYALLAPRRCFDILKGSALFDEIDLALRQVEQVAHRPAARPSPRGTRGEAPGEAQLEERFAYVPPLPRAYANRSEDIDAAFQSVADLTVLRFRYREDGADGGDGGKRARITAHPYAMVLHGGAITCLARDVDRGVTRPFVFERMSDLQSSETDRFELPADFALSEWLQGDFGVARAHRHVDVLVEFEPRAADAVRARKVHPTQKLAVARDGRTRASLRVPHAPEVLAQVRAWLLGFGAAAHVLEPQELADDVAAELRRAASRYGG
ncbi:MAG TPA: WYL domain-containing protein [Polyangiaceae bacterium]|jgi:predicted DNA-binding transcriptional regulator YafY